MPKDPDVYGFAISEGRLLPLDPPMIIVIPMTHTHKSKIQYANVTILVDSTASKNRIFFIFPLIMYKVKPLHNSLPTH